MQYMVPLKVACALLVLMLISAAIQNRIGKDQNQDTASNNDVPIVSFPFKNVFDDQDKPLNVLLIAAPFRTEGLSGFDRPQVVHPVLPFACCEVTLSHFGLGGTW